MAHFHRYAPGWRPEKDASQWQHEAVAAMEAWRFCPPCGLPLLAPEFLGDDPRCSGCNRVYTACPCACLEDSPTSDRPSPVHMQASGDVKFPEEEHPHA